MSLKPFSNSLLGKERGLTGANIQPSTNSAKSFSRPVRERCPKDREGKTLFYTHNETWDLE